MKNFTNKLLDRESNEFLTLMREKNLLANAIAEIEKTLYECNAQYNDFGWCVLSILENLKKKAGKQ